MTHNTKEGVKSLEKVNMEVLRLYPYKAPSSTTATKVKKRIDIHKHKLVKFSTSVQGSQIQDKSSVSVQGGIYTHNSPLPLARENKIYGIQTIPRIWKLIGQGGCLGLPYSHIFALSCTFTPCMVLYLTLP